MQQGNKEVGLLLKEERPKDRHPQGPNLLDKSKEDHHDGGEIIKTSRDNVFPPTLAQLIARITPYSIWTACRIHESIRSSDDARLRAVITYLQALVSLRVKSAYNLIVAHAYQRSPYFTSIEDYGMGVRHLRSTSLAVLQFTLDHH